MIISPAELLFNLVTGSEPYLIFQFFEEVLQIVIVITTSTLTVVDFHETPTPRHGDFCIDVTIAGFKLVVVL